MGDVLLVEDLDFVAKATRCFIEAIDPGAKVLVASTAGETMQALRSNPALRWRLILLDLDVPGATGLSLVHQISALGLAPITCVLTTSDDTLVPLRLNQAGFLGCVPKGGAGVERLKKMLTRALRGERVFHQDLGLTRRQAAALQLAASGMSSTEIARHLGVPSSDVDCDMGCAMYALGTHTRTEAVKRALALGFIQDVTQQGGSLGCT